MFDFLDAKTGEILHRDVSQHDNHAIHINNKIEISEKEDTRLYRIVDIVTPYRYTRGFLGGLSNLDNTRVYLELIGQA